MAKKFDSPAMPGVKPMPLPPDPRIIPLDRQTALTHQQVEQVRFGLGDTGPLAQAVMNANVPALAKQLATGAVQCLSTRRPADPVVGQMIFETDTQLSLFWSGSAWVNAGSPPIGAAGGMLSGTYPNPSVASISGLAAGGDLTGTYPNPTITNITNAPIYNSNTTVSIRTFGTERMGIDASGRVTKPFQPRFKAHTVGTPSITNGSLWPLGTTSYNVGSGFNTSTFRFTAPVAGYYVFGGMIRVNNAQSYVHLQSYVNGVINNQSGELPGLETTGSAAVGFMSTSFAYTRFLSASDTIGFIVNWQTGGGYGIEGQSHLFGYLEG